MAVAREICLIRRESVDAHCRDAKVTWLQILTDDRMVFAELNHILEEIEQLLIFFEETPVQPGDQVILAVRIVISITGVCKFITGKEHWGSAAAKENSAGIFHQAHAECEDGRIVCFTFHTTIPAVIVVSSIGISPTVSFVVFLIIAV